MIDFHSHLLPGLDDGASDINESMCMLQNWIDQRTDYVVATPHFYANEDSLESFLKRRDTAYNELMYAVENASDVIREKVPYIFLGAEVRYFDGIGYSKRLHDLCIEGTQLILLEMPFCKWTQKMIDDVRMISSVSGLNVVAAHIERYLDQPRSMLKQFLNLDILFQANAEFFTNTKTVKSAVKMLKSEIITFIGSDAHNPFSRPVNIRSAYDVICKELGPDYLSELNLRQEEIMDIDNTGIAT